MGMEVEMQHGDKDIEMGVQDILEHQRICLERQSRNEAQILLQYQDPGVPEPEEVMDTQPGEGVEEDCTVGYQGGTWWLGRWMMKDNTKVVLTTPPLMGWAVGKTSLSRATTSLFPSVSHKQHQTNLIGTISALQSKAASVSLM